jgi:hypothetical protein
MEIPYIMRVIVLLIGCGNVAVIGWLVGRKSRDPLSYACNAIAAFFCLFNALNS